MINSLICTLDMLWMYATCDACVGCMHAVFNAWKGMYATCDACVGCMHAVFDVWKGMPYVHVWRVEVHA